MRKTRMKQIRLLASFSQAEVAKGTKIHYSTISRLENGIIFPNKRHKILLSQFFKVDEEIIFPKNG